MADGTPIEVISPTERLARRMRELRKARDWSARQLAERVAELEPGSPLTRAALAKIETGKRGVSLDETVVVAAALGVTPGDLTHARPDDPWAIRIGTELEVSSYRAWLWETRRESLPEAAPEDEDFAQTLGAQLVDAAEMYAFDDLAEEIENAIEAHERGARALSEADHQAVGKVLAALRTLRDTARSGHPVDRREVRDTWRASHEAEKRLWRAAATAAPRDHEQEN